MSIRVKLMVMMICLTTLPVMTVTWIATNNTRSSVEKEILRANESRMMWADQYLDELTQQIDILFYTLQINESLMSAIMMTDDPNVGVQFRTQKTIRDTLTSTFHANSRKVDDLTLYNHADRKAFTVNYANSGLSSKLDITSGPWSRMLTTPVNMYFKQTGDGIRAYHSINRFEDRKLLGGLSVRIDRDVWEEVARILQSEAESSVFLLNDEGEPLSGSTSGAIGEEERGELLSEWRVSHSDLEFRRTANYYAFAKRVNDGQLTIIKAIPIRTVTASARATMKAGIVTGGLFAAASLLLSVLVSLRISRPIVSLARTMKMANVQNFALTSVRTRDEIGLLQHGYNVMMQRIKSLIESEYKQEIEVKNARLLALQAQINPHFLNNTLHMIGGMALSKDAPEIYRITRVIGDMLRYSISQEGDIVPIDRELSHIDNYLFIQEQRFIGRCAITVEKDERLQGAVLPKFTLQPLVENAFEHGLQKKEGAWRLRVRAFRIGDRVAVAIKDEGVGIAADKLADIREELRSGTPLQVRATESLPRQRGIGLRNVDARLKLQFGPAYGVRLFGKEGEGSLVIAVMPYRTMGGGNP
ncbi:sensor histidine kinase [Cohnella soli]|uniref:Sensor histidine kinase n=1 Tax=Cohnella soli TaxID=425005 RepID=A0ABW0HJT4_9BACL